MEKSHFPGYNKCNACNVLISIKENRDHTLECRGRSSVISTVETKLCVFCQKQIPIKELQDHVVKCNEQQSVSSNSPSASSEKKSTISDKSVNDLPSPRRSYIDKNDTDEENGTGYQTPPSEIPSLTGEAKFRTESITSKKNKTKLCALCFQTVDEADYQDHIVSCSSEETTKNTQPNRSSMNIDTDIKNRNFRHSKNSLENSGERKQTRLCALCSQTIDEADYQDHIASCSSEQTTKNTRSSINIDTDNKNRNFRDTRISSENSGERKQRKVCALCCEEIDEAEYQEHIAYCSPGQTADNTQPNRSNMPRDANNKNRNIRDPRTLSENSGEKKQRKVCALCCEEIDEAEYQEHIAYCSPEQTMKNTRPNRSSMNIDVDNKNSNFRDTRNSSETSPKVEKNSPTGLTNLKKKQRKVCALCSQTIDEAEYQEHITSCSPEQTMKNTRSSMNINTDNKNRNIRDTKDSLEDSAQKKQTKFCVLCSEEICEAEYHDHIASCSPGQATDNARRPRSNANNNNRNIRDTRNSSETSPKVEKNSPTGLTNLKKKQRKVCALCSQTIDEAEYQEHITSCSPEQTMKNTRSSMNINTDNKNRNIRETKDSLEDSAQKKQTKFCVLCSEEICEAEYHDHIASCSPGQATDNARRPRSNANNNNRNIRDTRNSGQKKQRKVCALCSESIDEAEYQEHIAYCSSEQTTTNTRPNRSHVNTDNDNDHRNIVDTRNPSGYSLERTQRKECVLCLKWIDESKYAEHISNCLPESSSPSKCSDTDIDRNNDYRSSKKQRTTSKNSSQIDKRGGMGSVSRRIKTKDCIMCFEPIEESEYENHVLACVAEKTENESSKSSRGKDLKCLTCNCLINKFDGSTREIPCPSHHNHCLPCLQDSMKEFYRTQSIPVCHTRLCDYQLSRHDISLIPLERRVSDRLLKLVKGEQRPRCPKCHFYVNINDNEDFDEHIQSCELLIPCEYCQLPYSFNKLEIHARQCRTDNSSENDKLINFILTRTKYPFTKEQIRFFIQQQNKNRRSSLDPLSIIDALAVFESIFPFEMPRRVCDICMEACPYDDIYVFDCDDSHKLCYGCYYQSCQTQMSNGQILTCALCTNPLRDGELNQLRVPLKELEKIRDYQIRKTFDVYSRRTRGVIKCPNQNCPWVAEAEDPNERFRILCPICQKQFCSLCNQQYHYRTKCQQLPQITQRWFFWCQTERNRYLTMRAQQDATYTAQLADYNRQNNENENRNKDLRRRYEELMNDEQYKTQNCRLCPSCNRVVQRLEGCDAMICGQDAHGGNVQSGCGNKFNWAQAQTYTPAATAQPRQTVIDLPKPDNPIVHHNGVKCDQCKNDVNGIRFDCVHCPSLTFCEKCEQQSTLNHSRDNQRLGQQQHVFKLIMNPQDEAIIL